MNPLKFFHNLFNGQPIPPRYRSDSECRDVNKELFFYEIRYTQASDLLLKEIELLVNGNIDLNKAEDKHKIQSLLKTFEETEYNLNEINRKEIIKKFGEARVSYVNLNIEKCSKELIEDVTNSLPDLERLKKCLSLISDIRERKREVDQRLKELGTNFCYYFVIKILKFFLFKKRMQKCYQHLIYCQK